MLAPVKRNMETGFSLLVQAKSVIENTHFSTGCLVPDLNTKASDWCSIIGDWVTCSLISSDGLRNRFQSSFKTQDDKQKCSENVCEHEKVNAPL